MMRPLAPTKVNSQHLWLEGLDHSHLDRNVSVMQP